MVQELEAFCGVCKQRRAMQYAKNIILKMSQIESDGKEVILKQTPYITGECPVCGTRLDIVGQLEEEKGVSNGSSGS